MAVDGNRVDPLSGSSASATIYTDKNGLRWSCMLNFTDVSTGVYGSNKFLMAQLIKDNGHYAVLQRWGRLGAQSRQYSLRCEDSLERAQSLFESVFQLKTGNPWPLTAPFEKKAGKYAMIELEHIAPSQDKEETKEPELEHAECTLPLQVQELLEFIGDITVAKRELKSLHVSVDHRFPLGRISSAQIAQGYAILQQLPEVIEELADRSASPPQTLASRTRSGGDGSQGRGVKAKAIARGRQALASNATAIRELKKQLKVLSSDFYSVIPHSFARSLPPMLNSIKAVKEKMDLLELLGNVETYRDLVEEMAKKAERLKCPPHPLDMRYQAIGATIEPLNESDDEFKMIQRYALASSDRNIKAPILSVLKVACHAEDVYKEKFDSIDNHQLLWHGTRISSAIGILSQGLRIAPASIPSNGSSFGRGIYFADTLAKSVRFCSITNDRRGILFLAEVALGTQHHTGPRADLNLNTLRSKFKSHSVHSVGSVQPAEDEHYLTPDGVKVPLGTLKVSSTVSQPLHSEFVVYHREQVKLHYLVTVSL